MCTFKKLSLVENRHKVQLPVIEDSEGSTVPKAQVDAMYARGGVMKSKFGGGGGGECWLQSGSVVEVTFEMHHEG